MQRFFPWTSNVTLLCINLGRFKLHNSLVFRAECVCAERFSVLLHKSPFWTATRWVARKGAVTSIERAQGRPSCSSVARMTAGFLIESGIPAEVSNDDATTNARFSGQS